MTPIEKATQINYYQSELLKVMAPSEYGYKVKIRSGSNDDQTKWMDINKESAQELISYLQNFLNS